MFCSGYTTLPSCHSKYVQTAFKVCILWLLYRLIIFRRSLFLILLSKSFTEFSTQQCCHVKFSFKIFDKSVNERVFLKIINLQTKNTSTLVLNRYIFPIQNLGQKGFSIFKWTFMVAVSN
jgi:hypothetical protein